MDDELIKIENSDLLIKIDTIKPEKLFNGGLATILTKIEKKALSVTTSVDTAKDREDIRAMAYKIARSKTTLDGIGKQLVTDWKLKAKQVDIERKKCRDYLDELKERVRKPLTDWELAEKQRIERINAQLDWIKSVSDVPRHEKSITIQKIIDELKDYAIDDFFGEFKQDAEQCKKDALLRLELSLNESIKFESEQKELERLREEAAKREKEAYESRLKKEAAEKAKQEVEAQKREEIELLQKEKEAIERKRREEIELLQKEKEAIERKRREEIELLQKEKEEKDRKEAERIEAERLRMADIAHREKVKSMILSDFETYGVKTAIAKQIINSIEQGKIKYLRIEF